MYIHTSKKAAELSATTIYIVVSAAAAAAAGAAAAIALCIKICRVAEFVSRVEFISYIRVCRVSEFHIIYIYILYQQRLRQQQALQLPLHCVHGYIEYQNSRHIHIDT